MSGRGVSVGAILAAAGGGSGEEAEAAASRVEADWGSFEGDRPDSDGDSEAEGSDGGGGDTIADLPLLVAPTHGMSSLRGRRGSGDSDGSGSSGGLGGLQQLLGAGSGGGGTFGECRSALTGVGGGGGGEERSSGGGGGGGGFERPPSAASERSSASEGEDALLSGPPTAVSAWGVCRALARRVGDMLLQPGVARDEYDLESWAVTQRWVTGTERASSADIRTLFEAWQGVAGAAAKFRRLESALHGLAGLPPGERGEGALPLYAALVAVQEELGAAVAGLRTAAAAFEAAHGGVVDRDGARHLVTRVDELVEDGAGGTYVPLVSPAPSPRASMTSPGSVGSSSGGGGGGGGAAGGAAALRTASSPSTPITPAASPRGGAPPPPSSPLTAVPQWLHDLMAVYTRTGGALPATPEAVGGAAAEGRTAGGPAAPPLKGMRHSTRAAPAATQTAPFVRLPFGF